MYSEYVKEHAYKLLIITSHGKFDIDNNTTSKFILEIQVSNASSSDGGLQMQAIDRIENFLLEDVGILGDHAFHNSRRVIVPYSKQDIETGSSQAMQRFNHSHSSDRMTSEHGIRFFKKWGVIRGRNDFVLFDNEDSFQTIVNVCWALHNYQVLGCPRVVGNHFKNFVT